MEDDKPRLMKGARTLPWTIEYENYRFKLSRDIAIKDIVITNIIIMKDKIIKKHCE